MGESENRAPAALVVDGGSDETPVVGREETPAAEREETPAAEREETSAARREETPVAEMEETSTAGREEDLDNDGSAVETVEVVCLPFLGLRPA